MVFKSCVCSQDLPKHNTVVSSAYVWYKIQHIIYVNNNKKNKEMVLIFSLEEPLLEHYWYYYNCYWLLHIVYDVWGNFLLDLILDNRLFSSSFF